MWCHRQTYERHTTVTGQLLVITNANGLGRVPCGNPALIFSHLEKRLQILLVAGGLIKIPISPENGERRI
jgi:hypothetical protein